MNHDLFAAKAKQVAFKFDDHYGNITAEPVAPPRVVSEWTDDGIALYDKPRTQERATGGLDHINDDHAE